VPIKSPNAVQSGEILLQDKAGNMIRWSPVQNKLIITANKEADLNVGTNLDVAIQGNATITVTGNINLTAAGGDITVAGISLVNHVHTGGTLGGGDTGPPVA